MVHAVLVCKTAMLRSCNCALRCADSFPQETMRASSGLMIYEEVLYSLPKRSQMCLRQVYGTGSDIVPEVFPLSQALSSISTAFMQRLSHCFILTYFQKGLYSLSRLLSAATSPTVFVDRQKAGHGAKFQFHPVRKSLFTAKQKLLPY